MTFSIFLLLASVYIRAALGGSLTVIDYDRQCVIWSDDNYGCTGHSSSFGLLDGDDCSDLSMITHGIRKDYSKLDVGLVYCFRPVFTVFIGIFIGIVFIGIGIIIFIGIYTFDIGIVSIIHFSIIKRNI
ncbi:hypothetical protein CBS147339_9965 [Penicillium roqueforti]|nr:hypothetical protein CBS147372_7722 [Penicillium roqueforti]KAI2762016.1 hypothetical protein DTO012A8_9592 [Penicillium roqueforti]KAI3061995.1 hypothetical protein CBS147339_9965 [Penicillium roqueforti]KAI3089671.1 hypothetical protein CBS147338_9490 [Penicillium roqueforti]KAI3175632.1 hypothetical protein DTO032C6_9942 [Penicillium roqueforti]